MKILNLYAGIGGNRKLWGDEHEITAVESEQYIADVYRELYPDDAVVVGDAHQYLLDHYQEFDFIWSSPPCPTHSRVRTAHPKKIYPDMKLYEEIIFLQKWYKGDWVVENVIPYYKPLIKPQAVLDRHVFWSNQPLRSDLDYGYREDVSRATKEELAATHGISLPTGTKNQRKLLRNAVRPELGSDILNQLTNTESKT